MGESAKLLNPEKTVLMPDSHADCPMAHMATVEYIEKVKEKYNEKDYSITDYESLFNLQAHLSNYESSVLIRIIYYVISNPSLNMAGLVSCIKLIDIMGIVGLLILAQKYRIIMILNVFKYVWCTIWIVKGMNSASVYLVINCLKWLSIGGLILVGIVILQWLFGLVRIILESDRFVHDL